MQPESKPVNMYELQKASMEHVRQLLTKDTAQQQREEEEFNSLQKQVIEYAKTGLLPDQLRKEDLFSKIQTRSYVHQKIIINQMKQHNIPLDKISSSHHPAVAFASSIAAGFLTYGLSKDLSKAIYTSIFTGGIFATNHVITNKNKTIEMRVKELLNHFSPELLKDLGYAHNKQHRHP